MDLFENKSDRQFYLRILKEQGIHHGLEFLCYCMMSNHIHLVVIPKYEDSLRRAIGEAHRQYTLRINTRNNVRGHLFQERFFSCPMDDFHLIAACRYVERNPVRAGLIQQAWEYEWSSARFHLKMTEKDELIDTDHGIGPPQEWKQLLEEEPPGLKQLRKHFRNGRPLGNESFVKSVISKTGVILPRKKVGRPRNK